VGKPANGLDGRPAAAHREDRGERFKVACGCQPPQSFWTRANQYMLRADHLRGLAAKTSNPGHRA